METRLERKFLVRHAHLRQKEKVDIIDSPDTGYWNEKTDSGREITSFFLPCSFHCLKPRTKPRG